MQEFTNWTIKAIRENNYIGSWLEERKFDWIPLISKLVVNVLNNGKTILVVTDEKRDWFLKYILTKINSNPNARPLIPIIDFHCLSNSFNSIKTDDDITIIKDMLDLSFPNGYVFWYIGRNSDKKAILPKVLNGSFMWIFDENVPNSFVLNSSDKALDMKLLQLYILFDITLDGVLYGQIEVTK